MKQSAPPDLSALPSARRGDKLHVAGAWIGIPAGLGTMLYSPMGLALLGIVTNPDPAVSLGLLIAYGVGVVLTMAGAFTARKALGLNGFAVVLACAVAAIVPLLFVVLVVSLASRLANYFQAVRAEEARLRDPSTTGPEAVEHPRSVGPAETGPAEVGKKGLHRMKTLGADRLESLERLTALWKSGGLNDAEFEAEKARVLGA